METDFLEAILKAVLEITEKYCEVHWILEPREIHSVTLAEQEAEVANLRRGFSILSEAFRVKVVAFELVALRGNPTAFVGFYPAATALLTGPDLSMESSLGSCLERYRGAVAYLAFATLRAKTTATEDLPTDLGAFLMENMRLIETYIRIVHGDRDSEIISRIIDTERRGIGVRGGSSRRFVVRGLLRRQPILWLMLNFTFPPDRRTTWNEASMWAIECLSTSVREGNVEPPVWPIDASEFGELAGWNQRANALWNEALIEVFSDMRRRFSTIRNLHLAI